MNVKELTVIMTILETAYPRFYTGKTAEEKKQALGVWAMMFEKDDSRIVVEAVKVLVQTLKFPPTIADVKEKMYLLTHPRTMSEFEAWGEVMSAIQNSNYNAQVMFDNLPEICQKVIGSPNQLREWAVMDSEVVNSVIQSNFMRSYKVVSEQRKEYDMLPESAKELNKFLTENIGKKLIE